MCIAISSCPGYLVVLKKSDISNDDKSLPKYFITLISPCLEIKTCSEPNKLFGNVLFGLYGDLDISFIATYVEVYAFLITLRSGNGMFLFGKH